jgi:hypothetical protein
MTKTGRILGLLLALVAVQSSYAQDVEPINYTHGEIVLEGYRALPKGNNGTNVPAVVILPYVWRIGYTRLL